MHEDHDQAALIDRLRAAYPELGTIGAAAEGRAFVVGGAVRDALLGRGRGDNLDVAVEGDASALAQLMLTSPPAASRSAYSPIRPRWFAARTVTAAIPSRRAVSAATSTARCPAT